MLRNSDSAPMRERLWLIAVLMTFAAALTFTDVLRRWDYLLYDVHLLFRAQPEPPGVAIVGVDEDSLAVLGRWPWPRRTHAQLLAALRDVDVKAIALDIQFSEPDRGDPEGDALLARAIAGDGRVVLPVFPEHRRDRAIELTRPLPAISAGARLGHVDVELDADGLARRVSLFAGIDKPDWPALPLAMLMLSRGAQPLAGDDPRAEPREGGTGWIRARRVLVPFAGPPGRIAHVSYVDALRMNRQTRDLLRGRHVLVGVTTAGIREAFATPVSGKDRPMPGVEFNANALAALLDGTTITEMAATQRTLLVLALSMLPVLVYPRCGQRLAPLACLALMVVTVGLFALLLRVGHVWFAPAPALLTLALSYPLWSWCRLDATVRTLAIERERAEATLRSIADGVVTTDREGRVEYLNPVAELLTGHKLEAVKGQPIDTVVEARELDADDVVLLPVEPVVSGGQVVRPARHYRLRDAQGNERLIRWSASAFRDASGAVNGMALALSDVTDTVAAAREVLKRATHDALTGLPNRTLLQDRLEQAMARARRTGESVAVLFVDLDGFKKVNDEFGHAAGDVLLSQVALRLLQCGRREDTFARWGGDEFVVVLEGLQGREDAASGARKILEAMAAPFEGLDQEVHLSASIGIALFPKDGEDVEVLLNRADATMYRVKERERNSFEFYAKEMNEWALGRIALENSLRRALRGGQFELFYQPQVSLRSGHVVGVEALLRWNHPQDGLIMPDRFIGSVEQSDLIHALGQWVIETACAQLVAWKRSGVPDTVVSINVSPRQLLKPDFSANVAAVLRATGADPARIVMEITERLFLANSKRVSAVLRELKALGIRLAIDDFGAGYASIGHLRRYPIHQLKIDKAFVRHVAQNADDAAIARAMIALSQSMHLETVAEGVENESQLAFFIEHECDTMQGFYFSPALPLNEITALLRDRRGIERLRASEAGGPDLIAARDSQSGNPNQGPTA